MPEPGLSPVRPLQPGTPPSQPPQQTPSPTAQPTLPIAPYDPATHPLKEHDWREARTRTFSPPQQPAPAEYQTAPHMEDPFDKLANDLTKIGLYVTRERYIEGVTWKIVANETTGKMREIRVNPGSSFRTEYSGTTLKIHVRSNALVRDCEMARDIAGKFINGGSSPRGRGR